MEEAMPVSLVIMEGPTPAESHPVMATCDPDVIEIVRRMLLSRMEGRPRPRPVLPAASEDPHQTQRGSG